MAWHLNLIKFPISCLIHAHIFPYFSHEIFTHPHLSAKKHVPRTRASVPPPAVRRHRPPGDKKGWKINRNGEVLPRKIGKIHNCCRNVQFYPEKNGDDDQKLRILRIQKWGWFMEMCSFTPKKQDVYQKVNMLLRRSEKIECFVK